MGVWARLFSGVEGPEADSGKWEEIDTKYLVHKAKLEDLEKHLVTASQQVTAYFQRFNLQFCML